MTRRFPDEMTPVALALRDLGLANHEIGRHLGYHRETIWRHIGPNPRWTPHLVSRAIEYRWQGLSHKEIARSLGRFTEDAVRKRLNRELVPHIRPKPQDHLLSIVSLKEKGLSNKEVAYELGLTPGMVKGTYQRYVPKENRLVYERTRRSRYSAPVGTVRPV